MSDQNKPISASLSMLQPVWHSLNPGGTTGHGELYQTSLMTALLEGIYEGAVTYGELHRHGDFGLGTFNDLDGEMVGFDGAFYQLRADGYARPVTDGQKTPFAVVTFFQPDREMKISSRISKQDLLAQLESESEPNLFTAIKISGSFEVIRTRTVQPQVRPFPPLTEATEHEAVKTFSDVRGTLAGFRTPAFAQGIGVAGFHMHFLREDRKAGGHALDYVIRDGIVQTARLNGFHVELPDTGDFRKSTLSGQLANDEIKQAEG
jgi:acetolactate decarboxylase